MTTARHDMLPRLPMSRYAFWVPRQLCHNFDQRLLDTCHSHFISYGGLSSGEAWHGTFIRYTIPAAGFRAWQEIRL